MSAKKNSPEDKPADQTQGINPFLESNKDPELEKKVDELLSVEEPDKTESEPQESQDTEVPEKTPVLPEADVSPAEAPPADEATAGPPLLPSDKLPALTGGDKKTKISVRDDSEAAVPVATETETAPEEPEPATLQPTDKPVEEELEPFEPSDPQPETRDSIPSSPGAKPGDDLGLEDVSTGKAVDEIVANEADELLAAHDHAAAEAAAPVAAKPAKTGRKKFWRSKKFWYWFILLLMAAAAAAAIVPASRYFILNTAGVRASSSLTVLDETNGQPLKNAEFTIDGISAKTDKDGKAKLDGLRLGPASMAVKKPAFEDVSREVVIGWGSNPQGDFKLKAIGSQYTFTIIDYVSKLPVSKAEATSGNADARSNEKGELILTLPHTGEEEVSVKISADNYRTETVAVPAVKKEAHTIELVPARKHAFITKRSGTYDVYKIDVDGKNEEKVLSGTGLERSESLALSIHPTKNIAALISHRENLRSSAGTGLSSLTIINLDNNSTKKAVDSERIQMVDWIGSKLIYVKIAKDAAQDSKDRHRLVSYDAEFHKEVELASSNYFNDVIVANGSVYYSPAAYQVNGSVGLYKTNAEGNHKRTVYDKEVWNLFRTAYGKLSVSIGQDWFSLNLDNDEMAAASGPPPVLKSRVYFDGPDGNTSLWTDERDGKGVLLAYDKKTKNDKVIQSLSGLKNPVRWLNVQHIIFRINNNQETADYVMSVAGGEARKIRDVTDTAGIDRWYYY